MLPFRTALLALLLTSVAPALAQEPAASPPTGSEAGAAAEAPASEGADASALAEPDTSDAAARMLREMSPLVADVQIVGPWVDGERTGIWRTITLQPEGEGAGNRFFVQQIEAVDGAPAVSSSTEITEVGEIGGALISYRADAPSEGQPELLTLFLEIVPLDGEIAETYELFFTAGEPYVFGPASN